MGMVNYSLSQIQRSAISGLNGSDKRIGVDIKKKARRPLLELSKATRQTSSGFQGPEWPYQPHSQTSRKYSPMKL